MSNGTRSARRGASTLAASPKSRASRGTGWPHRLPFHLRRISWAPRRPSDRASPGCASLRSRVRDAIAPPYPLRRQSATRPPATRPNIDLPSAARHHRSAASSQRDHRHLAVRGLPERLPSHPEGIAPPATGPPPGCLGTQATGTMAKAVTHSFRASQCIPFCTGVSPMHSIGRLERFQPEKAARQQWRPPALATPKKWHKLRLTSVQDCFGQQRTKPAETRRNPRFFACRSVAQQDAKCYHPLMRVNDFPHHIMEDFYATQTQIRRHTINRNHHRQP